MTFAALIPVIIKYSVYLPQLAAIIDTLIKRIDRMKDDGMTESEIQRFLEIGAGKAWDYPID